MNADQKDRLAHRAARTAELKDRKKADLIRLAKKYHRLSFDERDRNDDIIKAIVDKEIPYPYAENGTLEDLQQQSEGDDGGKGKETVTPPSSPQANEPDPNKQPE